MAPLDDLMVDGTSKRVQELDETSGRVQLATTTPVDEPSQVVELTSLHDNALISILMLAGPASAASVLAACRDLSLLSGPLWHALAHEAIASCCDGHSASPERWGLPHRSLLVAVRRYLQPFLSDYWVVLSDHPWCRLLRFKVDHEGDIDASSAAPTGGSLQKLCGVALRCVLEGETPTDTRARLVEDEQPTVSIAFRAAATTGGGMPAVETVARVVGREAELSYQRVAEEQPESASADVRAASSRLGTFFPARLDYRFLSTLLDGRRLLRLSWALPDSFDERECRLAAAVVERTLPSGSIAPPHCSRWLAHRLEICALELRSAQFEATDWMDAHEQDDETPREPCNPTLSLVPLPTTVPCFTKGSLSSPRLVNFTPPEWEELGVAPPAVGLYAASCGERYAPRQVEMVLLRVYQDLDASVGTNARNRLHLCGQRSRLGEVTLVATKVTGDLHVPSGAATFYIPLTYFGGQPVLPIDHDADDGQVAADSCWSGYGCLARPGFGGVDFREATLRVLSPEHFTLHCDTHGDTAMVGDDSELKHFYRLPPVDQA
jgi:hypothetical protein